MIKWFSIFSNNYSAITFVLIYVICGPASNAQTIFELPYDWSGQYGAMNVDGKLFWNTGWTSGPLLFDGTYTTYPERYGSIITNQFQPVTIKKLKKKKRIAESKNLSPATIHHSPIPNTTHPDTNFVTSTIDYKRGDYNYDELTVSNNFIALGGRYLGLYGFKRSYTGRQLQYFHPEGFSSPIQQSYRVDYLSGKTGWIAHASAARLVTESGLPDTTLVNGLLEDEILTAGLRTESPDASVKWESHIAVFQQKRRVDASWYGNSKSQFINRTRWNNEWRGFDIFGFNTSFNIDLNRQSIAVSDSIQRDMNWVVSLANVEWRGISASVGGIYFSQENFSRFFLVDYSTNWKSISLDIHFNDSQKPTHFEIWKKNPNDRIERRVRGDLSIRSDFKHGYSGLYYFNGISEINSLRRGYYSQIKLFGQMGIFKSFMLYGSVASQKNNYYFSDGIGKKVQFSVSYKKANIFDRLDIHATLLSEGLLDRDRINVMSPLNSFPLDNGIVDLEDIWFLHADISTVISTMTIIWSVRNIFQVFEPVALQLFPEKKEGDFLVQHNRTFPSMGRMIMVGIVWEFED